jgi:hypothetical protein
MGLQFAALDEAARAQLRRLMDTELNRERSRASGA